MNESTDNLEICRAAAADAKLISVLGAVTFYEAYFEQDAPADLANYIYESFELDKIRAEIGDENASFFIIYLDQHAVGYAKLREDSTVDCVNNETAIELQRIYTVERVFGKGVGERLLKHCLEIAKSKGFETLWLAVWEENRRALRFYEKHGFRRVGTSTFPYGETVGILFVMEKVL
jgi:ribosomal protein S18 acetylase RimI-like enzyme